MTPEKQQEAMARLDGYRPKRFRFTHRSTQFGITFQSTYFSDSREETEAELAADKEKKEREVRDRILWNESDKEEWSEIEEGEFWMDLPDYLNDFNAVARVRKLLTPEQKSQFAQTLHRVNADCDLYPDCDGLIPWDEAFIFLDSSAEQQCEAILRTLNLWIEKA